MPRALTIILSQSNFDVIAVFLAVLELDGIPAVFPAVSSRQDPQQFAAQQSHAFERLNPSLVITINSAMELNDYDIKSKILALSPCSILFDSGNTNHSAPLYDENVLFIQHSSGTTGIKKGVPFTDDKLIAQLRAYNKLLAYDRTRMSDLKVASWLPFYHDMGFVSNLLLTLYNGGEMAFIDPFDWVDQPLSLFRIIEAQKSNAVWMPNFAYRHLTKFQRICGDFDLSSVTQWINCSEPCKITEINDFVASFSGLGVSDAAMKCCYAMAETVFAVSQTKLNGHVSALTLSGDLVPGKRISVRPYCATTNFQSVAVVSNGPPIENIDVRILHDDRFLPERYLGEICLRGDFVFDGYTGVSPRDVFVDGYYRTGDLGFISDGEIYIVGREKDIIIINGENFVAHEIEQSVASFPDIKPGRVIAFGVYSKRTGSEELCIVAEQKHASDAEALKANIHRYVEKTFGVSCRGIKIVDGPWLVKSSSGKVARQANIEKFKLG